MAALWKGHITFGMVLIPVALHPAERGSELRFSLLDRRDLAPIGYRKVNKNTGEEVPAKDVAKGFEVSKGKFLLVDPDDLDKVDAEITRTIDILDFVPLDDIPLLHLDRPYWIVPRAKGEKAYRLLADTLADSKKAGIAKVVLSSRAHLAALIAQGNVLLLEILRYSKDVLVPADAEINERALSRVRVSPREKELAKRLVEQMSSPFDPRKYKDDSREAVLKRLRSRSRWARAGARTKEAKAPRTRENAVIDLMEVLKRSVQRGRKRPEKKRRKGA